VQNSYIQLWNERLQLDRLRPTLAHINNTDLKHPYYWAGFTIVGNPW
jgi:CHAT domain-containing protein